LRASLAIDEEQAKIEKFRKMILDKKEKIAQAERNIADYEEGIADCEKYIEKLRELL
jgi:peptidoglycan hydrolase CwlO-like protein